MAAPIHLDRIPTSKPRPSFELGDLTYPILCDVTHCRHFRPSPSSLADSDIHPRNRPAEPSWLVGGRREPRGPGAGAILAPAYMI